MFFLYAFVASRPRAGQREAAVCIGGSTLRLQRRRAAYNIDYAALNEGGSDFDDDDDDVDAGGGGGGDISAGEESLFKKQDPVLLRNATLETECASAKVKREKRMESGSERPREREE